MVRLPYHNSTSWLRSLSVPRTARFNGLVKASGRVSSGWGEPVFRSYAAKVFAYLLNRLSRQNHERTENTLVSKVDEACNSFGPQVSFPRD